MASQRRRSTQRLSQTRTRNGHKLSQAQTPNAVRSPFHHLHEHLLSANPPDTTTLASLRLLSDSSACHTACVVLSLSPPQVVHTRRGDDVSLCKVQLGDDTGQYVSVDLWGDKARWAECLQCGDLVYWRSVKVSRWRERVGLQAHAATKFTILERRGGWETEEKTGEASCVASSFAQRWRLPFAAPPWLQQHILRLNKWLQLQHGGLLYLPPRHSLSQARQRLSTALTPSPPHSALGNPASLPPLTIHELLHGRLTSGLYRLPCRIRRLYFPDLPFFSPSPSLLLSSLPPLSSLSSLIYRGCPHCGAQLATDADGVWRGMCGECVEREDTLLASEQAAARAVCWYYRPLLVQAVECGGSVQDVWLQLSHSVVLQLLVNLPASVWAVQAEEEERKAESELSEQQQQQQPPRRQSSRRLSKRRKQSAVPEADHSSQQHAPMNDSPSSCSASSDGRVLSCVCQHERCQWLGLVCALVDDSDDGQAAELDSSTQAADAERECTLTLLLRVDIQLDDNAEVQERHHVVVGCSIQQF